MSAAQATADSLGQAIFGNVQLGDQRRTRRLVDMFERLCRHPGGTLPDKLSVPADLKAMYRLCACKTVTHQALITAVRNHTLERIARHPGTVLVIHDATELDYSTLSSLADCLGQIGKGTHRGYICHNSLAVDAETGEVLGLLDQILHRRDKVPKHQTLQQHRDRKTRESLLWVRGTECLPSDPRLVDVSDQGSSTFEFLEHQTKSGRRFVLRNGKTRKVYAGHQPDGPQQRLQDHAQSLPELGRFTMAVQAQKGRQARKNAEFAVRGGPILLRPPHAKKGHHGNQSLPLYFVHVVEVSPVPGGEKSVEWTLLTNEPVSTFDDAWRVTEWYERRWIVEEYHKSLKTGCGIEDLQFTAVERMEPAIALLSAVALTLLNLRDASRRPDAKIRKASTMFASEYIEALSLWRHRKVRSDWTVHEFFMALARLGGHQNRKGDHPPGWLVLWRGWMKLQCMVDGYSAAQAKRCGEN